MTRASGIRTALLAASIHVLAGCPTGGGSNTGVAATTTGAPGERAVGDGAPGTAPGTAPPYRVAPGSPGGLIDGEVVVKTLSLPGRPGAPNACGRPRAPLLETSDRGEVAGVVVWLDGIERGKAPPPAGPPVELAVRDCALDPVTAVAPRLGTSLALSNEDPIRHELVVEPAPGGPGGGKGAAAEVPPIPMPLEGQRFVVPLEGPGLVRIRCTLHPDESAFVVLPPHPYVMVTGEDGRFRFDAVPPGRYRLVAWHGPLAEGQPALEREAAVELEPGAASTHVTIVLE